MRIAFDPAKNERNIRERGIDFATVEQFEFDTAYRVEDQRRDYKETRILAYGYIGVRLHVLCFKKVKGGIRVISLRKANRREQKKYDEAKKTTDR